MNARRWTGRLLLVAALGFAMAPAVAFADEPATEGTAHAGSETAGEHGAEAHGQHGAEGHGEHHLDAPRWLGFGHVDSHGRPQPPLIANIINFLILLGILAFAVKRMINPALAERRRVMEAEIGEAQRLRAEAEALHREYTERLEKTEEELAEIRAEFQRAGEAEYKRIIDEANRNAERLHKEAQQAIDQELKQLRQDLLREAADAATASAEKSIKTQISPQDQTRLADQYVAGLEKSEGASA